MKIFLFLLLCFPTFLKAANLELKGNAAILIEADSGKILFEKNIDHIIPPASMSKLMTLYVVFEAIESGRVSEETEVVISSNARQQIGSRMFLNAGTRVKIIDLIKGAIIQSGNDACVALAEAVSGSVTGFVDLMNKTARNIGLQHSSFANPTGLPHPNHRMSVRDLSHLAKLIIKRFPQYYALYSEKEFTWNNITQANRNPLLNGFIGADGIKTGHTNEAGYGLVGSALQKNMRLISVISGTNSKKERYEASKKLLHYGFKNFILRTISRNIMDVPVQEATVKNVKAGLEKQLKFPIMYGQFKQPVITASYDTPLIAPVKKGQNIGTLTIKNAQSKVITQPLLALEDIPKAGFVTRFKNTFFDLFGL